MSGKKPAIKDLAGAITTLEQLTGRRGAKLPAVTPTKLSFSNPPTQTECQALAARVVYLEKCYEALRERLDG